MSVVNLSFQLRFRWWVLPYLRLMDHLQRQCGVRIDPEKVRARLMKGTLVTVNGKAIPLAI